MNKIIFLFALSLCGLAVAQTNGVLSLSTNAPAANAKAKAHPPTEINSDTADFDLNIHQAIYRGHVLVVDPQVRLACDWMLVDFPAGGEHLNHVVATTNVVINFIDQKGQTNHITSARAVYDFKVVNAVTNETVTFTGNPVVDTADMTIFSEPLVWDRAANKYHFTEPRMIRREGAGTNGAAKLF